MIETIRAAFVIARRDFTAIIFSKSFFFFLLGPLFPLGIGVAAGGLGSQVSQEIDNSVIGVALNQEEAEALLATRARLVRSLGSKSLPELIILPDFSAQEPDIIAKLDSEKSLTAILSGTLAAPVLTGSAGDVKRWQGKITLLAETALSRPATVNIETRLIGQTGSSSERNQLMTAQAGQAILILLTMDVIFLGKLFAMLGMALVGITVWSTIGISVALLVGGNWNALPSPAVGWPLFCLLLLLYFSMAYLLLGSLFLGIGAMATTVREVQTLSMPVPMGQLLVFFLAYSAITKLGEPMEWFAVLFPFSSPFAMIARAAQMDNIWQHGLALIWQGVFTMIIIRFSVMLFRRNVMKSGQAARKKSLFARVTGK